METQEFVKNARKKLNLTQAALAEILGTEKYNISKYETGNATPPGDIILKIQELLYPENQRGAGQE